jgi:hypothetical protein
LWIAPAAVVNQKRVADWYSIAVMFCDVPVGISVQMFADAGVAAIATGTQTPTSAAMARRAWRNGEGVLIPDRSFR